MHSGSPRRFVQLVRREAGVILESLVEEIQRAIGQSGPGECWNASDVSAQIQSLECVISGHAELYFLARAKRDWSGQLATCARDGGFSTTTDGQQMLNLQSTPSGPRRPFFQLISRLAVQMHLGCS